MIEEWRPLFDFYEISNYGEIRSKNRFILRNGHEMKITGKKLKGWVKYHSKGSKYPVCKNVGLIVNNIKSEFRIHRLVLTVFIGPSPKGFECCHNDGNPLNNRLDNLRWDSHFSNLNDKIAHGTKKNPPVHRGVNHPKSIFKEEDILKIKNDIYYRGYYKEMAKFYNVHPRTINRIRKGYSYNER